MIHEVRVFDGEGNLKEIIMPIFDYEAPAIGNSKKKKCPECKKEKMMKGNTKFCSATCSKTTKIRKEKARRAQRKREEALKPIVPCELCGKPVKGKRIKYCGAICDKKARQLKDMNNRDRISALLKIRKQEIANA